MFQLGTVPKAWVRVVINGAAVVTSSWGLKAATHLMVHRIVTKPGLVS